MACFAFVFTNGLYASGLNVCLGKSYNNFLTPKVDFCDYESIYAKVGCGSLFYLLVIASSNILDIYFMVCSVREINHSSENVKHLISRTAYMNRKR